MNKHEIDQEDKARLRKNNLSADNTQQIDRPQQSITNLTSAPVTASAVH